MKEAPTRCLNRRYLLLAAVLSAAQFASFFDPELKIVTDVRYFLYFAWQIAEGAVPHLDLFDNKGFLASFIGALFYRLGTLFDFDPLAAIRIGSLGLCALGSTLVFAAFRRIGTGSSVAGFLGLFALFVFGYTGALPSVGIFPKIAMGVAAPAMALLAGNRRWFLAGLAGGLAFMDWQIGGLVGLGACVAAWMFGAQRGPALLRVIAGGVTGVAPFLLYYQWKGALGAAFQQLIVDSISRGSTASVPSFFRDPTPLADSSFAGIIERIEMTAQLACPEHFWLFVLGVLSIAVVPVLLWRTRGSAAQRVLVPLSVYHISVLIFSLYDFQGFHDFYVLVHSIAFCLGVLWLLLYAEARKRLGVANMPGRARLVGGCALAVALVLARPLWFRPEIAVQSLYAKSAVRLSEQQEVAQKVRDALAGGSLLIMGGSPELLFLMRYVNPIPMIYFNSAIASSYGKAGESYTETRDRLILEAEVDAFVIDVRLKPGKEIRSRFSRTRIESEAGRYRIVLFTRDEEG